MNQQLKKRLAWRSVFNRKMVSFLLFSLFSVNLTNAQNKAVILQNVWNNDLNNYDPKEFVDKLLDLLKQKLSVKEVVTDAKSLTATRKDENWDKNLKELVKARKASGDAYFIALASELRLPALNLGKLLFKNPPRSSKLTFTIHVFNTTGTEVIGDTIVNRGCVVRTVDEEKGNKYFYSDYNNFMSDMLCHLEVIRRVLGEKPLAKKQRPYLETK